MEMKVGTFNLNTLFSRFNFRAAIGEIASAGGTASALTIRYEFTDRFRSRSEDVPRNPWGPGQED